MDERFPPIDPSRARTYELGRRDSKVSIESFASPVEAEGSLEQFLEGLSDLLAVRSLRGLARAIVTARRAGRPVIWAMGGHVIKVGLSPVIIRLMERGLITGLALNGGAAIHDWEIAANGATSEDVDRALADGSFGMAAETGLALNAAAARAHAEGCGFGETLGRSILEQDLPHAGSSLLAAAARLGLPATLHVAIGSDTVHLHPSADGSSIGAAALFDFRRLVRVVAGLSGGVWVNCGSAVQLPEVFLKALSLARNLGHPVETFATANMDMIRHYRTEENVLRRPTGRKGQSFNLVGHHEINVPLLAGAIAVEQRRGTDRA